MSYKLKSRFTIETGYVTFGWIRQNYHLKHINYPIPLIGLSANFIQVIREKWKQPHKSCVTLSKCDLDKEQTITHICPLSDHISPIVVWGCMTVSTDKGYHQWLIKINNYNDKFGVGIGRFKNTKCNTYYCKEFYKSSLPYSMKLFKRETTGYAKNMISPVIKERVQDGDMLFIQIFGQIAEFKLIQNGDHKWDTRIKINKGVYKLFVGLSQIADSVTIIHYKQRDELIPLCNGWKNESKNEICGNKIKLNEDWIYCPKCGKEL